MNINLDYQKTKEALEKESNQTTTYNVIMFAVSVVYPNGLGGQLRRVFGRMKTKLMKAKDANADSVELESAEIDFLKRTWNDEKCLLPALWADHANLIDDEIDQLTIAKA